MTVNGANYREFGGVWYRPFYSGSDRELIFEVTQEANGGYWAECLTETIVTEGDTWEELRQNNREVVRLEASILISLTNFQSQACPIRNTEREDILRSL